MRNLRDSTKRQRTARLQDNARIIRRTKPVYSINLLNHDCLVYISTYLPAVERIHLEKVSSKLKRANDEAWRKIHSLKFVSPKRSNSRDKITQNSMEIFAKNRFTVEKVLRRCGNQLTNLIMAANHNWSSLLSTITKNCENLTKLKLILELDEDRDYDGVFSQMKNLQSINLVVKKHVPYERFSSCTTAILESLPENIKEISFGYAHYEPCWLNTTEKSLEVFKKWTSLYSLAFTTWKLDNDIMQVIGQMVTLRHLDLKYSCPRESGQISAISNLVNLEYLKLEPAFGVFYNWHDDYKDTRAHYNSIDDKVIESISINCQKLKYLSLSNFEEKVTEEGLRHISKLKNLEKLVLSGCQTDDTVLAAFKNLRSFDCSNSHKIRDNGVIGIIERSPNLEELIFFSTKTTDRVLHYAAKTMEQRQKKLHIVCSSKNDEHFETPFVTITQK